MEISILIAEDEKSVRTSLSHYIKQLGKPYHLIGSASNGEEAIRISEGKKVNIVLTDIKMPRMDGFELILSMKKKSIQPYFIVLSGYDDFEYARKAIQLGVYDYLLKPILEEDLTSALLKATSQIYNGPLNNYLLVNQEKWDMTLIRLESKLFDAIEHGKASLLKEAFDNLFEGFLEKVDNDPYRLVNIIMDNIRSLRKRFSSIDTFLLRFDLEGNRFLSCLDPQMPQEEIKEGLYHLLMYCFETIRSCRKQSCPDILYQCIEIIENSYFQNITLHEVASLIGVSPPYLSRVFKKEMGINFIDYLNKIRIEKAKELLGNEDIKIHEVSEKVGFNNPEYFTRIFKKYIGQTPIKFRQRVVGE